MPAWTLIQAHHAMARAFASTLRTVGLSPTEFGMLAQLDANPRLSHAELARRILLTPQSLGEQVRSLVERGLIRRQGGVPRGRRIDLSLTQDGRALLRRATPLVRSLNQPSTLGLTSQEAAALNTLLHKVRHTVGQAVGQAATPAPDRGAPPTPSPSKDGRHP